MGGGRCRSHGFAHERGGLSNPRCRPSPPGSPPANVGDGSPVGGVRGRQPHVFAGWVRARWGGRQRPQEELYRVYRPAKSLGLRAGGEANKQHGCSLGSDVDLQRLNFPKTSSSPSATLIRFIATCAPPAPVRPARFPSPGLHTPHLAPECKDLPWQGLVRNFHSKSGRSQRSR